MQAIILAAGMGKRLGELTKGHTKCMVKVNGETLISRLLKQLDRCKLHKIILVIGYKGNELKEYISTLQIHTPIEYVKNDIYDKTNNIFSLFLAKDALLADDTLLFESDIILEDSIIDLLIQTPDKDIAIVDKYEPWMDGTVVTIDEENRIERFVPKNQFKYTETADYYKTVNLYKFSKDFSTSMYVPFLEAYCKSLGTNEYYEQVLRVITMIDKSSIKALPLQGNKWYEIDDAQDLDIAESLFSENQYSALCSRYGGYWRYPKLLDFCYLVNPYFPNEHMREELKDSFDLLLTEYPSGLRINNLIAAKDFHIKQEYITVGNGAAELIKVVMEQLTGSIGIIRPTFEEYPNRLTNKNIIIYEATTPNFAYNAEDLISYFGDKNIQSLILINPDNPTGNYIPYADCLRLANWCEKNQITFILDESFIDFSTEHPTFFNNELLETHPHLIVIKSISKSYGVPGIRLGLLATSNLELMKHVRNNVSIWNINSFGEFFLQIYSKYESAYKKAMDKFRVERNRFVTDLNTIRFIRVIPSEANYILCEVKHPYKAEDLAQLLLNKHNILIKDCSKKCNGQYIRLAVRDTKDNTTLVEALRSL